MSPSGKVLPDVAHRRIDRLRAGRDEHGDAPSARGRLAVELVRRDTDSCVVAMSGELSRGSVRVAAGAVSEVLVDVGRVLIDLSGLCLTWTGAAQVFPSTLTAAGGWPRALLVLFGAEPKLARSLDTGSVLDMVPLAADETTARQLLQRRPPAVARHLDLDEDPSASRRARLFVRATCGDWQLDAVCADAVLVASELVGNAAAHARTACRLDLRLDGLGLTIAVRDYDYRGLLNPLACTSAGRRDHGLFLVASISQAWGVSPTENGKSVWALLPVTTVVRR